MARLTALLAQFAADPALRCGGRDALADELARLAAVNTVVPLPATTAALVADRARKTPDARRWRTRWQFSYREMRQQVVALAQLLRQRGVKHGTAWRGPAALGVPDHGAARHCRSRGRTAAAGHRLPDDRLRMMLEDARPSLLITSEDQLARFSDIPGLESLCYQQPLAAEG